MYTVQIKPYSAFGSWHSSGTYTQESYAINMAITRKRNGAFLARVIDKNGNVIFNA